MAAKRGSSSSMELLCRCILIAALAGVSTISSADERWAYGLHVKAGWLGYDTDNHLRDESERRSMGVFGKFAGVGLNTYDRRTRMEYTYSKLAVVENVCDVNQLAIGYRKHYGALLSAYVGGSFNLESKCEVNNPIYIPIPTIGIEARKKLKASALSARVNLSLLLGMELITFIRF